MSRVRTGGSGVGLPVTSLSENLNLAWRLICVLFIAVELANAGKYLTLRNAKIDMYRGSMRLAVDQWGKVEALEDASFKANVSVWLQCPCA